MNRSPAGHILKALENNRLRVRAKRYAAWKIADALSGPPQAQRVRYPTHASHPQHALAMSHAPSAVPFRSRGQRWQGGVVFAFS